MPVRQATAEPVQAVQMQVQVQMQMQAARQRALVPRMQTAVRNRTGLAVQAQA